MTAPRKTAPRKTAPRKATSGGGDVVTSAAAWQTAPEMLGHIIELPSGNKARLRRTLDLPELLKSGKIPNPLASIVNEIIGQKKPNFETGEDPQAMVQLIELINKQIPRIFVDPKVQSEPADWDEDEKGKWEPDAGYLSLEMIGYEDRMFAFAFAQGGPSDVALFRQRQKEIVATVENEQGVDPAPVEPAGD